MSPTARFTRPSRGVTIRIDPEFQSCIPPLLPEEFKLLEANILQDGKCTEPLTVWGNILVDGHNRHKICRSHPHIKFKTNKVEFESCDHAMLWIDEHQAGRRNINDDQRSILGKRIVSRRSKIAMHKQRAAASKAAAAARTARATGEENVSPLVKSRPREPNRLHLSRRTNRKVSGIGE